MGPGWDRTRHPGSAVRLASVASHVTNCATRPAGLNLTWSENLKTGFLASQPIYGLAKSNTSSEYLWIILLCGLSYLVDYLTLSKL